MIINKQTGVQLNLPKATSVIFIKYFHQTHFPLTSLMYFLTLLYLQRQNFGASQTVLCHVQLNLSLSDSKVKLFHESKVTILWWQGMEGTGVVIVKDILVG